MLTNVQKETLQTLINLYQSSNGKSIKGIEIAEVLNRNPGTIRNQMISLRGLNLVKSVPGPGGGYKPTIQAYHTLKVSISDDDSDVPIYKNGKKMEDISVAKIEFTSVPQPDECEAEITVLGSIKDFNLGDEIRIGPTPVNNLGIMGKIVGRDDLDNILLVDTNIIRSIPKKTVVDIASKNVISFKVDCSIKDAAKKFDANKIDGAPVIKDGKIVGVFTVNDLVQAIIEGKVNKTVGELMSTNVIIVPEDLKLVNAIELMVERLNSRLIIVDNNQTLRGIVTRTDLMEDIANFNY